VNSGTGPNPLISLSASSATAGPILNYVTGSPAARDPLTYVTPAHPQNVTFTPYFVPVGRINEWTFSVEHEFSRDYAASIAYVGSHGSNLQFPTDLNQITNPTVLAAGPTTQAERPYPLFGNISGNFYNGISNYNALQVGVVKRYSYGLTFQANYVWSHFLDDQDSGGWGSRGGVQNWQIGNDPAANYGNSNFDIPQAFKAIVAYELPFGRNKNYLHNGVVSDALVGGWRLSSTFITQSGNPFTVIDTKNNTYSQCGNGCVAYPNVIGNPFSNVPAGYYFNPAAFAQPSPGTFGNEGRNFLRGPRLTVMNLSLGKQFHFGERFGLELRADFVNALNHPSFQAPHSDIGSACVVAGGAAIPCGTSNFGIIDASAPGFGPGNSNGIAVAPRSGQLSARFTF
jgi:hypothetical protein